MQQLVTKEHENFNKQLLATKVLNKSFFKIQNIILLVSCCFPRRRLRRIQNTKTQVHCCWLPPTEKYRSRHWCALHKHTYTHTYMINVWLCVCVCVCMCIQIPERKYLQTHFNTASNTLSRHATQTKSQTRLHEQIKRIRKKNAFDNEFFDCFIRLTYMDTIFCRKKPVPKLLFYVWDLSSLLSCDMS